MGLIVFIIIINVPSYTNYKYQRNTIVASIVLLFFFLSCNGGIKDAANFVYDPEIIPDMNTDSVTMLVSDSGLIRYKMIGKTWLAFNQAKDPHSLFPDGFYLEQYDSLFNVVMIVKADSVWYFNNRKLCRLLGNVFIRNQVGETFTSDELFWDQRTKKIYSDKHVIINRPEKGVLRVLSGFESNEQMTAYRFLRARNSEFYIKENSEDEEEK